LRTLLPEASVERFNEGVTAEVNPAVAREVGEAERQLHSLLPEHVSAATAVAVRLAVDEGLAGVESRLGIALPRQVTLAVDESIGPAVESRVRAAEARIDAGMSRQVRSEIGSMFKRLAQASSNGPLDSFTPSTSRAE
jgi:hypothetical protein